MYLFTVNGEQCSVDAASEMVRFGTVTCNIDDAPLAIRRKARACLIRKRSL
jgi:hypothetical protein